MIGRMRKAIVSLGLAAALISAGMASIAWAPAPPLAATPTPSGCESVKEALAKEQVKLALAANGNLFFRDALGYTITNLTTIRLDLCFPAGMSFAPEDPGMQILLLGQTAMLSLDPGQTLSGTLFVFCTQLSKHAPTSGDGYTVESTTRPELQRMAEVIDAQGDQGRIGAQLAVWAVTDNFTLDSMLSPAGTGGPNEMVNTIRPLLCLASGEVDLGEQILEASKAQVHLYTGTNPVGPSYCASQGLPAINLDTLKHQAEVMGMRALAVLLAGTCGCLIVAGLIVYVIIRLIRRK